MPKYDYFVWKQIPPVESILTRELHDERIQKASDEGWRELLIMVKESRGKGIWWNITPHEDAASWNVRSNVDISSLFTKHDLDYLNVT